MRNNQHKSASGQIQKACRSILGSLFLLSCLMAQPGFGAMPSSAQQKAVSSIAGSSVTLDYHRVDANGFPVIVSYVSVNNDSGFNIGDLTEDNFKVFEDGTRELPIQVEELTDSVGVSVILVIDRSTSMKDKPIADAKNAASTFIQLMNAQDEAAIVSFASHVTTDHPYSSDKASLLAAISNIVAKGGTAIFDALIHSAGLVRSNYGRQAIILLTDGQDKDSQNTMQDAIRTLVPLGVPVYTIGLNLGKGSDEENVLQTIASATGGRYYRSPTSDDLEAIYRAISRLLHHFYRITYTTHNPLRDGTLRHVLIEAAVNNSTASDTASYRAPLDRVTFAAVTGDIPVPGREFSIEIEIPPASNPIYKMERLQFTLSYDAKYLQVKQPYAKSLLGGDLFGGDNDHTIKYSVDPQKGELQIILTKNLTSGPVDGTGKIARLVFQTSAQLPDRYPLRFKFINLQALNVDGKDIPSETRDLTVNAYGNVTVALNAGSKLRPGKPFVLQVVIPANAKYLPGMQSIQFTLKYDPSYLRINEPYDQALQMGKLFGSATQNQVNFEIKPSQGTITMSLMKKQGFPQVEGRGELAQVVFSAAWNMPDSTEHHFEFLNLVATDSSGWVIPTTTQNLTVYSYG
ncbi:MAG: VWA domain-containing protein, partial [Calditrichaeota bacterium]